MAGVISKAFNPKKTRYYWAYFVLSIILIVLGIFLMPIWGKTDVPWKNWGNSAVYILIAAVLLVYLFTFLVKKVRNGGNGTVKVLTIIEFILLGLIALGCIFLAIPELRGSVPVLTTQACRILGLAFYFRGVVEIFRAYYNRDHSHYPVWWLVCAIALVTLGVWMFLQPFFSNLTILWILVVIILLLGVLFFIDGFLAKPESKRK